MSNIGLALTFANRKYDPELPELIHAWDEYSIDENPIGYDDSKREAIKSLGSDLLRWVTVDVRIDDTHIIRDLMGENVTIAQAITRPRITASSSTQEEA